MSSVPDNKSIFVDSQWLGDGLYRAPPLGIRRLTPAFGAEVTGINRIAGQPEWLKRTLNQLWFEYGVLLFRDLDFDEARQVEFSRLFGELEVHGRLELNSKAHPELIYLTNRRDLGLPEIALQTNELDWHSDQTYLPRPALGSLLYAVEVPPADGDTYWADMRTAYERLPESLRHRIDSLIAIHDYENVNKSYGGAANEFQKKRTSLIERHPLVRTHPITLRRALYLAPRMVTQIEGLSDQESAELLNQLVAATTTADLVYRHRWRAGDAILWDNARVMHRRDSFPADIARFMRRTTIRPPAEVSLPF
jgi:taurine dioxygenase